MTLLSGSHIVFHFERREKRENDSVVYRLPSSVKVLGLLLVVLFQVVKNHPG